jgi:hypothetical protein
MSRLASKCRFLALFSCCFFAVAAFAVNAPSNLVATATSNSSITLTWTDNSSDESGFTFKYDTNSAFTNPTYVWTGGANVTSYVHTNRGTATTYYYRIKAEGSSDPLDSTWTSTASTTTMPSGVSATATSSSSVNVSWTGNSSNTSITGYTVATNTSASFSGATYQYVSGAGATSLSKTSLNAGTTYYFAVKAEGTADAQDSPFTAFASATTTPISGEPISPRVFGINAWMPYQIGAHIYYGGLDNHWSNIGASGAKSMRYGGNGVDHYADPSWVDPSDTNKSTLKQYHALVNSMQAQGIEPILQVPVYGTTYDASDAAAIVQYINVTQGENVKYWIIGNEPDLQGGGYGYTTAAQVAAYFKPIASAMKAVDPTIKIIGPETAWYDETIINGLTTCGGASDITGTDSNGRYYVDIISFHLYGFDGTQTHDDVVGNLMSTGGFNDDLVLLKARIANCNSYWNRTGTNALKMAVTEANVNYTNSSTDSLTGAGAISFVGGQWWAEALGIAMKHGVDIMTFWSTIEGNQLGYISSDGTTKRPSYYMFQMMAQNFRGDAVTASDNQAVAKTFAAKASDQTAVLIMNQSKTTSFPYTVRLDMAAIAGSSTLKVNVDAGMSVESSGTISTESSIILVFDASGILKKKIEYKRNGHASSNLPPSVTTYP